MHFAGENKILVANNQRVYMKSKEIVFVYGLNRRPGIIGPAPGLDLMVVVSFVPAQKR